jgi:dynein heavy chain
MRVCARSREYILEIPAMLVELKAEVDAVTKDYDLLDSLLYNYTAPDVKQRWHCYGLPHLIHSKIAEAIKGLDERQAEFEKAQQDEQDEFNDEVANLSKMVTNFQSKKVEWQIGVGEEGDVVEETAAEVKRIQKRLVDADAQSKKFNSREVLFGQPQTDYSDVGKTSKMFEPYAALWLAMNDFDKKRKIWMTDPFTSLDAEEIEKSVQNWWRTVFKVAKGLEANLPDIFQMANQVKADMEAFKTNLPIITALRNPGMRERHWKALSEAIKIELDFNDSVTLDRVLNEMKLPDFMEEISKVGDLASKEYMIEKTLLEMKEGWVGIDLDLMEYRDTGSHVLRGLDDTLQRLDDNIVMAQVGKRGRRGEE